MPFTRVARLRLKQRRSLEEILSVLFFQIRIVPGGKWHRRGSDNFTACGRSLEGGFMSRDAVLDDELCHECFSRHEIATGEMKKLEREILDDHEEDRGFDADEEPTDPSGGEGDSR